MKYLSTMHSHTTYCDGDNTPSEMAEAAYKLGFVSYGFSAHSTLPFNAGYEIKKEDEEAYREDVLKLKTEYDGKMEILLGLELDADSSKPDFNYDYLISSVHQLHINGNWYAVDHCKADFDKCISAFGGMDNTLKAFYSATVKAALRDNIDIVGHIDLIGKFNETNEYFDPTDKRYLDLVFSTIDAILEKRTDIVFEVNTGAISRGYRTTPYPDSFIIKEMKRLGFGVVISSDCHQKHLMDCWFTEAEELLRACGYKERHILTKEGFVPVPL